MASASHDPPRRCRTILVTGFGAFPGSPRNPTEVIVAELRREAPRLRRLGVELRCLVLPVRYDGLQERLDALARDLRPDAVLHLGVAGRRRRLCVEVLARNRAGSLRPDAARRYPRPLLLAGAPPALRSTFPARRIRSALRMNGVAVDLSRDAGDYVCNATLYRSLAMDLAPEVGFLHVPRVRSSTRRAAGRSPSVPAIVGCQRFSQTDLTRAALLAVLALAPRTARRQAPSPCAQDRSGRSEP